MADDIVTRLRELADSVIDKTDQRFQSLMQAADEVMYLREENNKASALIAKLAELLLPYSMLMNKHEQEMLIKVIRGE